MVDNDLSGPPTIPDCPRGADSALQPPEAGKGGEGRRRPIADPGCAVSFPPAPPAPSCPAPFIAQEPRLQGRAEAGGGRAGAGLRGGCPASLRLHAAGAASRRGHRLAGSPAELGPHGLRAAPQPPRHRPGDRPKAPLSRRALRSRWSQGAHPHTQTHTNTPPAPAPRSPSRPGLPLAASLSPVRGASAASAGPSPGEGSGTRGSPARGGPAGGGVSGCPRPSSERLGEEVPSLPPSSRPLGPLPRPLPAHSPGAGPRRGRRCRRFFHTLVGSCAPRSVTGELAARRRLPPARTRARLRAFRLVLPAAGRRGSPGHSVGRRRKRRRREEEPGAEGRGGGREACYLQPPRERPR